MHTEARIGVVLAQRMRMEPFGSWVPTIGHPVMKAVHLLQRSAHNLVQSWKMGTSSVPVCPRDHSCVGPLSGGVKLARLDSRPVVESRELPMSDTEFTVSSSIGRIAQVFKEVCSGIGWDADARDSIAPTSWWIGCKHNLILEHLRAVCYGGPFPHL